MCNLKFTFIQEFDRNYKSKKIMSMINNAKLRWSMLVGSIFLFSLIITAQPGPDGCPHHKKPGCNMPDSCRGKCMMIDNLSKDLSLTAEQTEKVKAIHAAHFQEMKTLREQDSICMAKNREQHMQLKEKMDSEIKALLTAEQKVKYDSIMAERMEFKDCPRHKGPPCKGHGK